MVFTRSEREEYLELINTAIKSELQSDKIIEKLSSLESLVVKFEVSLKSVAEKYESQISLLEEENKKLNMKLNKLEQHSRRNSIRIFGLKEENNEDIHKKVKDFFSNKLNVTIEEEHIELSSKKI
ncbi:hypothetical protein QE152_g11246 [Popillia japonica]|uniref:Uncharacterized protein n=1 Tax=Popillia japonica TaxID=7064 RepID=A0AAW1LQR4_POPJA